MLRASVLAAAGAPPKPNCNLAAVRLDMIIRPCKVKAPAAFAAGARRFLALLNHSTSSAYKPHIASLLAVVLNTHTSPALSVTVSV